MSHWTPYMDEASAPWNLERVVHLHRRAGFGANYAEIQRDLADGPQMAVSRLLKGASGRDDVSENFEAMSATIARAAADAGDAGRLKAWWVYRCLVTPDPLGERLTLMWHNHFATSLMKVTNLQWMLQQNLTLRKYARSDFRTLFAAMFEDPALLSSLDATENRPGHPNENLAREVLELFTLGVGHYTEHDIREVARTLTGITISDGAVQFDASQHDSGEKTIFGKTALYRPQDLPDLFVSQTSTSERLAWRLCWEFFGENVVSDEALQELAAGLRANQLRIDGVVETILRSNLFFRVANLRSRIADPASFLICPLRSCECMSNPPSTLAVADSLRRMGLDLLTPPNVGGWPGGRAWLSTRTIVARTSAIADLVSGRWHLPTTPIDLEPLLQRNRVGESLADAIRFLGVLFWGTIDDGLIDAVLQTVRNEPSRSRQLREVVMLLLTRPQAQLH